MQLLGEMRTAGLEPNVRSIEIMVDSAVVAADCDDMMACLQVIPPAPLSPNPWCHLEPPHTARHNSHFLHQSSPVSGIAKAAYTGFARF